MEFNIIKDLIALGAAITAYDPEAMKNVKAEIGDKINYVENQYDALANADALLVATEWCAFKNPDFNRMKLALKNHIIFDGRNIYELNQMKQNGIQYHSVGRQIVGKV